MVYGKPIEVLCVYRCKDYDPEQLRKIVETECEPLKSSVKVANMGLPVGLSNAQMAQAYLEKIDAENLNMEHFDIIIFIENNTDGLRLALQQFVEKRLNKRQEEAFQNSRKPRGSFEKILRGIFGSKRLSHS